MAAQMFFRRALLQAAVGMTAISGLGLSEQMIDMRGALPSSGQYPERDFERVNTIVIHHTATTGQGWGTIANFHVLANGWQAIGYHLGVSWDARTFFLNPLNLRTNHCGGCNSQTIGIALLGNFERNELGADQAGAAENLVRFLMEIFPNVTQVRYHGELKATACPGKHGIGWVRDLRQRLEAERPL